MQSKYDRFVLAAGDSDFEDAIRYIVDERAKEFVLVGFGPSLSTDLQSYACRVVFLEEHWAAIQKGLPGPGGLLEAANPRVCR